ncbi:uncharacterized protein LOC101861614 [Aplysia californica]|uniref:Uncharacterized protein LOC101861614 n=1 Tax=Aplysia californica TaxID=6500 RepID=A0ABM0K4B9_APLCA|nr:uncharacterized protein LOC101861614 [Aplysia californica]
MSAERGAISELAFALFPNMEEMIKLHESLVRDIKERSSSPSRVVAEVGDLLLKRFDGEAGDRFRKGCAEYCRNQAFALDGLKKQTRRDPKLSQLLTEAQSNAMCRRLELKDLVPSQMQRLTKYPLLIDNLLKYTQANSEEHRRLERGLEKCKHILAYVNQAVKECENFHKLKDIQKKLDRKSVEGSTDPALEDVKNLNLTTRKLIFDGPLTWKLRSHRTVDLHALLFEDMLVLLQKQDDKYVLKCQNANAQSARDDHKFTHSPVLRLQNLLARNLATDKKSFFVVNISEVRAQMYEFSAATTELRIRWCNLINSKAEELKESATSTNNPVTRSASAIIPAPQLEQIETERNKIRITRKERSASTPSKGVSPARQVDAVDSIDGLETAELSQDSELIQPEEVNVAHAVTAEAIPVRTPLELLRENENIIEQALSERQRLVLQALSLSWDQCEALSAPTHTQPTGDLVSGKSEPESVSSGEKSPELLLMRALSINSQFIQLVNSATLGLVQHQQQQQQHHQRDHRQQQQQLQQQKIVYNQFSSPTSENSEGSHSPVKGSNRENHEKTSSNLALSVNSKSETSGSSNSPLSSSISSATTHTENVDRSNRKPSQTVSQRSGLTPQSSSSVRKDGQERKLHRGQPMTSSGGKSRGQTIYVSESSTMTPFIPDTRAFDYLSSYELRKTPKKRPTKRVSVQQHTTAKTIATPTTASPRLSIATGSSDPNPYSRIRLSSNAELSRRRQTPGNDVLGRADPKEGKVASSPQSGNSPSTSGSSSGGTKRQRLQNLMMKRYRRLQRRRERRQRRRRRRKQRKNEAVEFTPTPPSPQEVTARPDHAGVTPTRGYPRNRKAQSGTAAPVDNQNTRYLHHNRRLRGGSDWSVTSQSATPSSTRRPTEQQHGGEQQPDETETRSRDKPPSLSVGRGTHHPRRTGPVLSSPSGEKTPSRSALVDYYSRMSSQREGDTAVDEKISSTGLGAAVPKPGDLSLSADVNYSVQKSITPITKTVDVTEAPGQRAVGVSLEQKKSPSPRNDENRRENSKRKTVDQTQKGEPAINSRLQTKPVLEITEQKQEGPMTPSQSQEDTHKQEKTPTFVSESSPSLSSNSRVSISDSRTSNQRHGKQFARSTPSQPPSTTTVATTTTRPTVSSAARRWRERLRKQRQQKSEKQNGAVRSSSGLSGTAIRSQRRGSMALASTKPPASQTTDSATGDKEEVKEEPKSPFIGYKTAYDFLSSQKALHGGVSVSEQRRESYELNRYMGEGMCEIFNKHYVPTRIGGKCV